MRDLAQFLLFAPSAIILAISLALGAYFLLFVVRAKPPKLGHQ